jgi:hypothetical protein
LHFALELRIRLKYAREATDHFVLPDFPPHRARWDTLRDSAVQIVITFLLLGIVGFLIVLFLGGFLAMLLGQNYFGEQSKETPLKHTSGANNTV